MIRLAVAFALGAGWAAAAWWSARVLFAAPLFARRNVRGADVPVAAGLLAVLGALAAQACLATYDLAVDGSEGRPEGAVGAGFLALGVALGFALLGLVDDLAGDQADKGFAGHLRALRGGRLTTGGLKLVGGGLVAVAAVATFAGDMVHLAVGAVLVALGANTVNLFDRAPGRATKVSLVAAVMLAATAAMGEQPALVGVAAVVGGAAGLLGFDLREQLMLGDAGANPLGAVLALGVALTTGLVVQGVVVAVLVALNVAGERTSFSAAIDRMPPLRALDRLGRARTGPDPGPSSRSRPGAG